MSSKMLPKLILRCQGTLMKRQTGQYPSDIPDTHSASTRWKKVPENPGNMGFFSMLLLAAVCLFGLQASAQTYYPVTHGTGSVTVNGIGVTVTRAGNTFTSGSCTGGPAPYFLNGTAASFTYTFATPVSSVRVPVLFLTGVGIQTVSFTVNGSPYTLTSGNISGIVTGSCGSTVLATLTAGSLDNSVSPSSLPSAFVRIDGVINSITVTGTGGTVASVFGMNIASVSFDNGTAQNFAVCQNSSSNSLSSVLSTSDITGSTFTWSVVSGPTHGSLSGFPAAASSGNAISPSGTSYTPTSGYSGADAFTVQVSNGVSTTSTVVSVNVKVPPASIAGASSVCVSGSTTLSNSVSGGTWSSSNSAVATVGSSSGLVNGIANGTATITYSNGCGVAPTQVVAVATTPAAIGGSSNVCQAATITLSNTSAGGTWSSNNTAVATVGTSSGVVTGVSGGTATITYSNGCGSPVTKSVSVTPLVASIAGPSTVCNGSTITLSNSVAGGTWSSSNSAVATVGTSSGIVTSVAVGTATITYGNGCGTPATQTITVNPLPASITGASTVCNGSTATLSDATAFGAWTSSNSAIASIGSSTGIVSGVATGSATITYTLTTGCFTTTPVTVNPLPASISGTGTVCVGLTTALTNATAGGNWSSSNTALATVSGTGVVTGVASGNPTITYTLSTGCFATTVITVNPLPAAITGTMSVCSGLTTALSNTTGGGAWSSSNSAIASVVSGTVTGGTAGTATITYALPTTCMATAVVTVNPLPASISGTASVCVGLTTTLTDATAGGTWTSSNVTLATIGTSSGIVTGVAAGNPIITYTLPTGCIATVTSTVNPLPAAITGTMALCPGTTTSLTNATAGGAWSSGNTAVATVSSGTVTGVVAGTATITYTLPTGCISTAVVTVNPLPAAITGTQVVCVNATTTLADVSSPGSWSSSNTALATVGSASGIVTGVSAGTPTITYKLSTGCIATVLVTVNPVPVAITGTPTVCVGNTTNLANATGFGNWSSSSTAIATVGTGTGIVTGIASGTPNITYTLTTGCFVSTPVTVNPLPTAISGTLSSCIGATSTLSNATGGGTWTSSNTSIATVNSSTGVVTGATAGTTTITYTLTATGCIATSVFTVNPFPATITGTPTVCVSSTTTLADASPFGAWSSSNTAVATIGSGSGTVSGVTAGTATITYTLNTGCITTTPVTVNPLPASISGTPNVCIGLTTTLTDATSGGTWTSSDVTLATVGTSSGVVTGIASGTPRITYTIGTGCMVSTVVTVNNLPANITGTTSVCAGLTTTLSDATAGGAWTSGNTAVATINSGGIVTGVTAGTASVTYTLPTGCIATTVITVNPLPANITGTANVCVGLTTNLASATPFGAWSSSNTGFVNIGSGTGIATGVAAGTATVTYTLATGCITTTPVTVNPLPSATTGTMNVCVGLTTTLTNSGGGTWSSSNTTAATINSSGVVTGVAAGTTTITYTLPTGCITTSIVTVNPLPSAITGTTNVCISATTALASATPLGAWSSSNTAVATVGSGTGVVTGATAGTTTITYTLGTGCITTTPLTVNPFPAAISGTATVCVGLTTTLTDATSGGNWSSSNSSVASVNTSTGVVTGVVAGTATITYTLTTGCSATRLVTVNPLPSAISGTLNACVGLTSTLTNSGGGAWSSSNTAVATVNSSTGVVTGVLAGTTTITYTLPSTGCISTAVFTVNPLPAAISGTLTVCEGLTTSLTDATLFGAWSSSVTPVATINPGSGVVTGIMAGTTTITYTLATGCIATAQATVNPLPAAISGASAVCVGLTINLSSSSAGGGWTSSNTLAATVVSGTGVVTGVGAGTTTITYTLPTGCTITKMVTVNPLPAAITGTKTVCVGLTTTLSNATGTGTWSSSDGTMAPIGASTGIVTGLSAGVPTITYMLATGCISTTPVTVNPLPANITGTMNVCAGLTTALSSTTPSGVWTSSNTAAATINSSTGLVSGVAAGTTTITYTLPTSCIVTAVVTVNPLPSSITGTTNVCVGLTTTLTDATPFGSWTSSNTTVATVVTGTGVVTGLVAGTTTITYTLTTGCITTTALTVNPLPVAITGTATVCAGLTTALTDATPLGAWSSSNTTVATINSSTGILSGLVAGTTTVTYTLPTGCIATRTATVNPLPVAISGPSAVCAGLSITLSNATGTGAWSSSNTAVATINSASGVLTGIVAGTTTVTYTLPSTGCIMTTVITVNPLPAAITGTASVCIGLTTNLTDATAGGTWSSSNLGLATVGTSSGIVTGLAAGTLTITYTLPTGCIITRTASVNPLPSAITGTMNVCVGLTTTLSNTGGGTWSSGNTAVATVNSATGVVTGVLAGTATITYTLPSTGCITTAVVLVNPLPAAIVGVNNVCLGLTTSVTNPTPFGMWSSSNTALASIGSATGLITGLAAGPLTITYMLSTGCISTLAFTVNPLPTPILGTATVCEGLTTTLTDAGGGTWASSDIAVATIGTSTGVMTGIMAGTTLITYTLPTGCIITRSATVNPLPAAITGAIFNVCEGLTITLNNATGTGSWSSSNTGVATINSSTGVVTGILAGTTIITYTLPSTGCIETAVVTVDPLPATITGATFNVCEGLAITLSDATPSGSWSSSNTAIATVNAGTGVVTGVVAGTATITYTLPTGCIMTAVVTVDPLPAAITGTTNVCEGLTTTLSDATGTGTWSSSNTAVATIDATTGVVSGILAGTATITYTIPTGCIMTTIVTVDPLPAAITGTTFNVCEGLSITLSDATPAGTWSSSNTAIATADATTGVITGVSAGISTITYTLPTGCIMTATVTVDPLPAAITGTMNVCEGLTTTLSDATGTGTWSSSNTAVATIDATTGLVTGVAAGTVTITYTIPTGCIMTTLFTVNPLPSAITGTLDVCHGLTTALNSTPSGGSWSYDFTPVTTIITVGATTGIVTGVLPGTNTVTYTLPTGCITTAVVLVNPLPAAITGTMSVCEGLTTTLSDATPAGTWSSSDVTVATVDMTTGVVTGMTAGTAVVTYTLPTGCIMTAIVTVDPLPAAITGSMNVCAGLTTTMSNATAGGTWSSSDVTIATVNPTTGVVTGIVAGTATVTYTLPTGCIMTSIVTVDPLPAAITGAMNVCAGLTTTMSNATTGGTWSSSDVTVATVDMTTGVVTGVVAGTATVTYTLPTGCIMTAMVTVDPLPTATTGIMNVCIGNTTTLSNVGGGTWSSSNLAVATINASTGVAIGVTAGTALITYTLPTGCITTSVLTVNPLPVIYTVTGGGSFCTGGTGVHVLLSGSVTGVNYQLYNGTTPEGVAVPGTGSGIDFGLMTNAGTYTVMATDGITSCSSTMVSSATVSTLPLPIAYAVTGGGSYCVGGKGVNVGLANSDAGVNYELYVGGVPSAIIVAGTGAAINFGLQTAASAYTVAATNATTSCTNNMTGSATVTIGSIVKPSVSIYYGSLSDSICAGTPVTFTAIPVNGGTAPAYEWKVNGTVAATSSAFTFAPANGDVVAVELTSNAACAVPDTAVAAVIMPIIPVSMPTVTVSAAPGDTVCAGTLVNYTAATTFGGSSPMLTWVKNGTAVGTGTSYSYVPNNGDIVYSMLVSNYRCRDTNRVYSNNVTMTVQDGTIIPSVSITAEIGEHMGAGTSVTLSATAVNGGKSPIFTWYVNGKVVTGATANTLVDTFMNGDSVSVRVTRTDLCGLSTFNSVVLHLAPVGVQYVTSSTSSISVIPNPNKGEFTVKGTLGVTNDVPVTMELTNMLGQVVYSGNATAKNGNIEERIILGNSVANGMYLLNLRSEAANKTFHVVIEQ